MPPPLNLLLEKRFVIDPANSLQNQPFIPPPPHLVVGVNSRGIPPPPSLAINKPSQLLSKEQLEQYRRQYVYYLKMISVGVPLQAVKNTMQNSGLDPDILDKLLN